jgi:uncharacterized protein
MMHPVHNVYDGVFNSVSGKVIDLREPKPEMIDINDIAIALGNVCRFGGHTSTFYSVAQHCTTMVGIVPPELKKVALLHDASEAYLGDVIKPLKVLLGDAYGELEYKFNRAIFDRFCVPFALLERIRPHDRQLLEVEHLWLQKGYKSPYRDLVGYTATAHTSAASSSIYLAVFNELFQ